MYDRQMTIALGHPASEWQNGDSKLVSISLQRSDSVSPDSGSRNPTGQRKPQFLILMPGLAPQQGLKYDLTLNLWLNKFMSL